MIIYALLNIEIFCFLEHTIIKNWSILILIMQRENGDEFDILIIADNPSLDVLPTVINKPWVILTFIVVYLLFVFLIIF